MARQMSLETTEMYAVKVVRHYVRNGKEYTYPSVYGPYHTLGTAKGVATSQSHPYYAGIANIEVTLYKATVAWEEIENG